MTAGKTTTQVFGLFGLLATAISFGFTAADVAAQEVAPKVMTAGEAVYTENCAHCHKATGQGDGGAAPTLAGLYQLPKCGEEQGSAQVLVRTRMRSGSYQSWRPVSSIAAIHAKSKAFFDTLSSRIAALRNSSFVKNFG